jgi:carotenoid cleavage dioxygenase-like enzyme
LMSDTKAEMLIIDAKSMKEIARLHLPQRVPFGVHACWIDEKRLRDLVV